MLKKLFCNTVVFIVLQMATDFSILLAQENREAPMSFDIKEIVVRPTHNRYSRRNNPAVDFIRKVIEHKDENRIEVKAQYKVEKQEKLSFSIDDFSPWMKKNGLMKQFPFMDNYLDTSEFNGKPILPVSIRETLSDYYYRREPRTEKIILKAKRHEGIDQTFDNEGTLSDNLEEILKEINIFDNNMTILLNKFVSPLSSSLATTYYEYYIVDTLELSGKQYANLAFVPANRQSYGFTGYLYVTLDGNYAVKKVAMNTSRNINLNWVNQLHIEQEFRQEADSTWVMDVENTYAEFAPVQGVQQLYVHQFRSYDRYDFAPAEADSVFRLKGAVHVLPEANAQPDTFWINNRHVPLLERESRLTGMLAEMKKVTFYNVVIKAFEILITDCIPTHPDKKKSVFDFVPVSSTFSSNYVEGFRFRLGGATTANLHPQWFAAGYLAYGLKDRKFKYQAKLTYSFTPKKYHEKESPYNNLSLLHEYDVYKPGGNAPFTNNDNMFVSLKVGTQVTQMQYIRKTELRYEKEWLNSFSIDIRAKNEKNEAAGTLHYNRYASDGTSTEIRDFTTSSAGIQLRFAPGEKAYNSREGKSSAFNLAKDAPVFKVFHQTGFKGILGGDYTYNYTEVSAEKRVWLSSFGHIDAIGKAGKVWNRVPFPMLVLPNTNQSIMLQSETFNMMRPMEFVSDEYASFYITYYLKGWILNRIPLVNRLKLREIISLNVMQGRLSDQNNPAINPAGLFQFPAEMVSFGKTPYLEGSIGLDNIFKILRVDYYRRLTYLDEPNIKKNGFRIAFRFAF